MCPKHILSCNIVDDHFLDRSCVIFPGSQGCIFPGSHASKSCDVQVVERSYDRFPRSHDPRNLSHDPTCDSSCDLTTTCISCDLTACDPGKITHNLPRKWLSTMSHDKTHFGHTSNPLINTWKIMGTINKMCPLNDQQRCNAMQSMKTQPIGARPHLRYIM